MKNFTLTLVKYDINLLLKLINKTLKEVLIHFNISAIMRNYSNQFDLAFVQVLGKYLNNNINHKNNKKIKIINNKYFIDGIISYPSFFANKLISFKINEYFKVKFMDNIIYMVNNHNITYISIGLHLQRVPPHKNNYLITIKFITHVLKRRKIGYIIKYNTLNSNPLLTSSHCDGNGDNQFKLIYSINKQHYYGLLTIYNFYCWYIKYVNSKKYIKKQDEIADEDKCIPFFTVTHNNKIYFPPSNDKISTTKFILPVRRDIKELILNKIIEPNNSKKIIKIIHVLLFHFNRISYNQNKHFRYYFIINIINKIIN